MVFLLFVCVFRLFFFCTNEDLFHQIYLQKPNQERIKYGFIESPVNNTHPMCLICQKVLSNEAMKPSRLKDHLIKIHNDKKDCDVSYFQKLKENF